MCSIDIRKSSWSGKGLPLRIKEIKQTPAADLPLAPVRYATGMATEAEIVGAELIDSTGGTVELPKPANL
jgi:hypothetical protein